MGWDLFIMHHLVSFDCLLIWSFILTELQADSVLMQIDYTSFGTRIMVRLRSTFKFSFQDSRGRYATKMNPLLIDRDQVFPKPASQPASAWFTRLRAHTHTAELKIIKWWRRSGR